MIHVKVCYGRSDKLAPLVTDDLIPDLATANERARQELAKYMNIIQSRSVQTKHVPTLNVGDVEDFANSRINIWGAHLVTSIAISMDHKSRYDSLTIEQFELMP